MTSTRRRTAPLTVRVEQPVKLPHSARLFGPVSVVMPAIRTTGSAWQFDQVLRCYLVPRKRVDDVMVAVETAGHRIELSMAGWS